MSLLNNVLELRSDAFKITALTRRPVPARTDTIGPWLNALSLLTWLGALTNAALVYLFHPLPTPGGAARSTALKSEHPLTAEMLGAGAAPRTPRQLLLSAALVALAASHGFVLLRAVVRHALERALWKGNKDVKRADEAEKGIKENYMRSLGVSLADEPAAVKGAEGAAAPAGDGQVPSAFWEADEGLQEIRKAVKDA